MLIVAIISDFSFQIPTTEKSIKLVYVYFYHHSMKSIYLKYLDAMYGLME